MPRSLGLVAHACGLRGTNRRFVQQFGSSIAALVLSQAAIAAILPDHLGPNQRKTADPIEITTNKPLWDEYGLEASEKASYGSFRITAYQFKDTTGAYAAAEWLKSTEPGTTTLGNYVISCTGQCPKKLTDLLTEAKLPKFSHTAYPSLEKYLPKKDLIAASRRYILGPAALAQFEPRIPSDSVAFDFSPEIQFAKYRTSKGDENLALISYPTPEIARQQTAILEKIANAAVKRAGPLVAVTFSPGDRTVADKILADVDYKATVAVDDQPLPMILTPQSTAQMILSILALAGIVLGFCVFCGLAFGAFRILSRKFGYTDAGGPMTTLHLSDK